MSEITSGLLQRYPAEGGEDRLMRDMLEDLWLGHRPLADKNFVSQFCSGNEDVFLQRYTEMRLGHMLRDAGWSLQSGGHGPDFKAIKQVCSMWLEAVTPTAGTDKNRLPKEYLCPSAKGAHAVPAAQILLRVTSVIKAKHRKLVGSQDEQGKYHFGYIDKG